MIDGSKQTLKEDGAARIDASAVRKISNPSDSEDVQYLGMGALGGYVGWNRLVQERGENPPGRGFVSPH